MIIQLFSKIENVNFWKYKKSVNLKAPDGLPSLGIMGRDLVIMKLWVEI